MKKKILFIILPTILLVIGKTQAQTVINSLIELKSYLDVDDANIKLTPGIYNVSANDITNGTYGSIVPGVLASEQHAVFLFEGNNSTYDFTGVTINIDTEVLTAFGSVDVREIQIIGNNNVLKNLTLVDDGSVYDAPAKRATSIVMDGSNNRIEGFHCTIKGSYPYGYGDIFGKGGGSVINHRKHSACLLRGNSNHLKDCTFIQRSYGHCIFFQAANDPLVEGCYVEGELRTTDDVLAEEGTGSPADNVDFMTVWGYRLNPGWTFSLHEAGIRAYNGGSTIIDGLEYERTTSRPVVKNNTVVKMRVCVNVGWAAGDKIIENCKSLACEVGYWGGSNADIINCSGDTSIGPLYSEDVGRSGSTIDLTILDNYIPRDGNHPSLYLGGTGHNYTIKDGTTSFDDDIQIFVGGTRTAHRWAEDGGLVQAGTSLNLTNESVYPIILGSNASSNGIVTCGPVNDNGTSNTVSTGAACSYIRPCENTAENLQAECYDAMLSVAARNIPSNTNNEREVYGINSGDWISFNNIDLTNMVSINAIASSLIDDIEIEVRDGSETGTLLATIPISSTFSNSTYQEFSANLNQTISGLKNVYFVFTHPTLTGWLFNLDKLSFVQDLCTYSYNPYVHINAENFCDASEITIKDYTAFNQVVSSIENNDYIKFSNVDFGYNDTYNSIKILASSNTTGGNIEVRSGSVGGTLLATVPIENTGSWDTYNFSAILTSDDITGLHDIYLVFKGGSGDLFNLDWFQFGQDFAEADNLALASNGSIATQSSNRTSDGFAPNGIDGNTDGSYGNNSVTHTSASDSDLTPWWQVDLQENKIISKINIYGRTDGCCVNRLSNYTLSIIDSNGTTVYSQLFTNAPAPLTSITIDNVVGKIVKIQLPVAGALSVAEVQVFGTNTLSVNDSVYEQIKLYPNPARNEITISNAAGTTIEIFNINGVMESTFKVLENKKVISVEHLNSGLHFIKFNTDYGTTVKKLIKL